MAGVINYLYDPNQQVYVINVCTNNNMYVIGGTVLRIRSEVLLTTTTLKYDVRLQGNNGTIEFEESDVFATLNDAMTEYQLRLS